MFPIKSINPRTWEKETHFYKGDVTLWDISRLFENEGLELSLFDAIVEFHGQYFADVYGEGIISDRNMYDIPLEKFASDWLVHFCVSNYK